MKIMGRRYGLSTEAGWAARLRMILACMVLLITTQGPLKGQVEPSAGQTEPGTESSYYGEPGSVVSPEEIVGLPVEVVQGAARPPLTSVYSDTEQQMPVMMVRGDYFDPSGLGSLRTLSEDTNQSIKARMLKCAQMGFRCFLLRVDWPGVQPEPNRIDSARIQDFLSYADELGLEVIISLELERAPAWFFQGQVGSGRVMVSYLVDPERETATGNDGDLRWANGTGNPIMYHPDTERAVGMLIVSLYNSLKDEKALLGWYLSGPVTLAFPGGGRGGVVGMCDYSPFTVNKFNEVTGTPLMAYPLPRFSQGTRDTRPDFRLFVNQRLQWKRESFDGLVSTLRKVDKQHLVLVGMDPVLNYRNDNGYLAEMQSPDAAYQLMYQGVDGAIIDFRLASDTFEAMPSKSGESATHLVMTINQIVRNKKIAIVLIEPDRVKPPNYGDIPQLAYMIKAAGAYPIWCSGFGQKRGQRWNWEQENAIEKTQPLSLLPPPRRLRRGHVAILDLPGFYGSFYAEENDTLKLSLLQLAMHQRTGVVLEVVGSNELKRETPILSQYRNIIYLSPDLTTSQEARSWIDPGTQIELAAFRMTGGVIEAVSPMLLNQYALEGYRSPVLEDELRTRYVHRGATADFLYGADALIVANQPYVFIRVNSMEGARYLDVKLAGWPQQSSRNISFMDISNSAVRSVEITSGNADFHFRPTRNESHLFLLNDNYIPTSTLYENRVGAVTISQQSRSMRRSVPAALLLAALLGVTLLWMTFQSQRRSLLQVAELAERRRQLESIDILDDAEVMAFYKAYVSSVEKEPEQESPAKQDEGG
jgi:hypothetical protein